jgi:DNA-binding response OmpR family regulator
MEKFFLLTVLLLEGGRPNGSSFAPHLEKRFKLLLATSGKEAVKLARQHQPDVVILDSTSMRTSGDRIAAAIRNLDSETPIIHIKEKPSENEIESSTTIPLYMPLTYRKLLNRIERYMSAQVGKTLTVGDIQLNLHQHILTTPKGETKLTPKLSRLMEILMRNRGQIVERKQIIKDVWQTDYMGDTRTLDVHIRWIRQAIEDDPGKPCYIKTIRGKGYLFDAPAS